jgi:HSP20 family protein
MSPHGGSYGRIHQLRSEVNRLIDLLLEEPSTPGPNWQPPVDLIEREDAFEVQVELPGVAADEIQVELRDLVLTVRGTKQRLPSEPTARRFHLMERFIGAFQLSVELPRPIDPSRTTARLANGVLSVTLPRVADRRHRSFTITIAEEGQQHE